MKTLWRYWGYLLLALLVMSWGWIKLGPPALAIITGLAVAYFLFQAPAWCGAVTRDNTLCRRNSSGLLLGCSIRQHKWQKLKFAFAPHCWGLLKRAWMSNAGAVAAMVGAGATLVAGFGQMIVTAVG